MGADPQIFCKGELARAQDPSRMGQQLPGTPVLIGQIPLMGFHQQKRVDPGLIHGIDRRHPRNFGFYGGPRDLMYQSSEIRIFLGRPAHHGKGEDGIFFVMDGGDLDIGVVMGLGIIAQVVSEGPFPFCFSRNNDPCDTEIGIAGKNMLMKNTISEISAGQGPGKGDLGNSFGKRHDRSKGMGRRTAYKNADL